MNKKIPPWIMVWSGLMALIPLGFSILDYVDPSIMFPAEAVAATTIWAGPVGLYVSRNMATALATIFAMSQRSASMLILALLLRIIEDVFDVIHNGIAGTADLTLITSAAILIGGSAFAISKLWPLRETA